MPARPLNLTGARPLTSISDSLIQKYQQEGTDNPSDKFSQMYGTDNNPANEEMAKWQGADVGRGFLKGAGETALNIGTGVQNIGQAITGPNTGFKTLDTGTSENQQARQAVQTTSPEETVGKTLERAAEFMIPGGIVSGATKTAAPLVKIGGQVLADTAVATAQEGELNKNVAKTAVASAALSSLPYLAQSLVKYAKTGETANKIARNLEEKSLRLTPTAKQQLEKSSNDVLGWMTEQKLTGTPEKRFDKISTIYDGLETQVQKALKNSGKTYSKEEFKNLAKNIPEKYATEFDNPEVYDQLVGLSDKLVKYADNFTGDIPVEKINQFKRSYYKNAFNKAGDQVMNEARLAIADTLYGDVLKHVDELKGINGEYSKAIMAKKLIGKALGRNELGLIGNIVSTAAGAGIGGAIGGPIGAAAGTVVAPSVAKRIAGTETRSAVGAGIQTLSDYLKNLKPDQAGNLVIPKAIYESLSNGN